ncbi:MAG: ribbon-helix-helix protein, CopG family [Gaiellaceae bacterium]
MASERTPFSARLAASLVERLKAAGTREGISASQVAERYIDEGLRSEEFPGITFRPGPAGRRAGLVGGPDVWEIVRDLRGARAAGADDAVALVAETSDLSEAQVRLASAYYAAYPDEIDERIAAEEALTERLLAGAA